MAPVPDKEGGVIPLWTPDSEQEIHAICAGPTNAIHVHDHG